MDHQTEYTQSQKALIQKMSNSITQAYEYQQKNSNIFGGSASFFTDLYPFVALVEDALMAGRYNIVEKVLNKIENFLDKEGQDSKDAIQYFFFETLTNRLSHQDKEYSEVLARMLGPHSKQCCEALDRFWGTRMPGLYRN